MREDAWLAERLGRPAFTLEEGDERMDSGPGFYQAKVDCGDVERVNALEDAGMRVVDVNVTFWRPAGPSGISSEGVRDAEEGDRDAVLAIAERDYTVSRFHLDPGVPDDRARAVKRDWVANFFRGARGDRLLVHGAPARGFNLVIDGAEARLIDLIAVSSGARGGGTGSALVAALLDEEPARDVMVGTQASNSGSQRFYQRLGFRAHSSRYVLHGHMA